ncbi:MAG TPA: hypothetical protein VHL08_01685 [Dongiaceae bacterium]|nr:hypothetical protein [Dongiaceae bacterium]
MPRGILVRSLLGAGLTILWLALAGFYVDRQVGLVNLLSLLPHEIALVVLGVVAPILLIWFFLGPRRLASPAPFIDSEFSDLFERQHRRLEEMVARSERVWQQVSERAEEEQVRLAEITRTQVGILAEWRQEAEQARQASLAQRAEIAEENRRILHSLGESEAAAIKIQHEIRAGGTAVFTAWEEQRCQFRELFQAETEEVRAQFAQACLETSEQLDRLGAIQAEWRDTVARESLLHKAQVEDEQAMLSRATLDRQGVAEAAQAIQSLRQQVGATDRELSEMALRAGGVANAIQTAIQDGTSRYAELLAHMRQDGDQASYALATDTDRSLGTVQALRSEISQAAQDFHAFKTEAELHVDRWRATSEAMRADIALLENAGEAHLQRSRAAGNEIAAAVAGLEASGERAEMGLARGRAALEEATASLEEASARATAKQEKLRASYRDGIADMATFSAAAETQFSGFARQLGDASRQLRDALTANTAQTEGVMNLFSQAAELLTQLVRKTTMQIDSLKLGVEEQVEEMRRGATGFADMSQRLREELHDQTNRFTEAARQFSRLARAESEETAQFLTARAETMAEAIEHVGKRGGEINARLAQQVEALVRAADLILARAGQSGVDLESQTQQLARSIEKAAQQAEGWIDGFTTRAASLAELAQATQQRLAQVIEEQQQRGAEAFLGTMDQIVEELSTLGVDIHGLLEDEAPPEIWHKYRQGDRGIFARLLIAKKDPPLLSILAERYDRDEALRARIDRYIDKFESLLGKAATLDPLAVLPAVIRTSDVGKLYAFLVRSSGRRPASSKVRSPA